MIQTAKKAIPNGDFHLGEAVNVNPDVKFDFVISNSVFHYMTRGYAEKVLDLMLEKSMKGVAVLEVPDFECKAESEKMRQDALTPEEYRKKYEGLAHTYYDRNWFREFAKKRSLQLTLSDVCVPNYIQSRFLFNCFIQ